MKLPKTFFGWTNIKWLIQEFAAMYSNKDSYFSKKRFESSMAFLGAMFLIIGNVLYHKDTISNSEVLADATLLFIIAGYTVKQIQGEKKDTGYSATAPKKAVTAKSTILLKSEPPAVKDDGDLES